LHVARDILERPGAEQNVARGDWGIPA
jgi:hypothetical protein